MIKENDSSEIEKQHRKWEVLFSDLYKANGKTRGRLIEAATRPLCTSDSSTDIGYQFVVAVEEYANSIDEPDRKKFLGYFNKCFYSHLYALRDEFEKNPNVPLTLNICRILKTFWGRNWEKQERFLLEGRVHEFLSDHCDPIRRTFELDKSQGAFQRAQALEEAERVARKKRAAVLNSPILYLKEEKLPNELKQMLSDEFDQKFSLWQFALANERLYGLVNDCFKLCNNDDCENDVPDIPWDKMEALGVIITQQLTSDGRTSKKSSPSSKALRVEKVNRMIHRYTLVRLTKPIQEWLNDEIETEDNNMPNLPIYQYVFGILKEYLNLSDSIIDGLNWGLQLYMQEHYHPALSVLLPIFEGALRDTLFSKGEWTINPKEVEGPEQYYFLENLFNRARKHYPLQTVSFWQKWFAMESGLGLNLRHDHCHGILKSEAYCDWVATGTLLSFFFLLQSD